MLGPEIAVSEATEVPESFDARFSARWRRYRYSVVNSVWVDPQVARFVWHSEGHLDVAPMTQAARSFVGQHDFSAFCRRTPPAPGWPERSRVRNLLEFDVLADGPNRLDFWVAASSFCHHQVRSMVGTLVEVGQGSRSVASVAEALQSRDRQQCGRVAPAHGLTLWEVGY
jgi:tRNA pseudouridine38-40 synthase